MQKCGGSGGGGAPADREKRKTCNHGSCFWTQAASGCSIVTKMVAKDYMTLFSLDRIMNIAIVSDY